MGLLSKLKSLLGMEEQRQSAGSGVDVTVEREPSTESEEAVKEPSTETEATEGEVDEPVATETDAAASTESLVDEEHADDPTRAAEPAEAGVTDEGHSEADVEPDVDTGETDEETGEAAESVSTVKGIGPAYASRLEDAGVETVGDLAGADPEELAERVDLSPKRVGRWVDSANDRV
ncbi:MAG: helix-hairpin-helix domain-containing protein [Halobacterium sp.]